MKDKLKSAMGFCAKARKCIAGDGAAENALKKGDVHLILLDESASDGTRNRWVKLSERYRTPILVLTDAADAVGKSGRKVIVVLDQGFARMIMDAAASEIKS